MTITCHACGHPVEGRIIDASTYDNPAGKDKVPWRCSKPDCPNRDPRNHVDAWYVLHQ